MTSKYIATCHLHNTRNIGFMTEQRSREALKSEKVRGIFSAYKIDLAGLKEVNKDEDR